MWGHAVLGKQLISGVLKAPEMEPRSWNAQRATNSTAHLTYGKLRPGQEGAGPEEWVAELGLRFRPLISHPPPFPRTQEHCP